MRRHERASHSRRTWRERATALGVLVDGIVSESEAGEAALRERLIERVG